MTLKKNSPTVVYTEFFFIAVQRAYVELGNNDYMYSPAPIKPAYNDHHGRGGYYPTSPQHFQMDERK